MNKFTRIALKTILWIIGSIIGLLLLAVFLIRLPSVQNYLTGKISSYVEHKIGTPFRIGYINIEFPKKIVLENVYLEDQSRDTLFAGENLKVDINMFKLLKNTVELNELDATGITAKIKRTLPDSTFNFDYIIKAFSSQKESTSNADTTSAMTFNLDKINFERFHIVYKDDVIGTSADVHLQALNTRIKKFDLTKNMAFDLPQIKVDGLNALVKQWTVFSPDKLPRAADFGVTDKTAQTTSLLPDIGIKNADLKNILVRYVDSTAALNTKFQIKSLTTTINKIDLNKEIIDLESVDLGPSDHLVQFAKLAKTKKQNEKTTPADTSKINWVVAVKNIKINETNVAYRDDNQPRMKGFDYFNIGVSGLSGELSNLYYSADSIGGSLKALTAKDRSGFQLKQLKGDFYYTNTGAEIKNLFAQTPMTLLQDYIKISYPSLDEASKHPEKIYVNANLKKSKVDMRDIYYFAPFLDTMEVMKPLMKRNFNIDGRVIGKVNDLTIPHLDFKTLSNTRLIASARIKGLPDPNKLYLDLNIKKLNTGRSDIEKLVARSMLPKDIQLPNTINLTGTFKGSLNNFTTNLSLGTEKGSAKFNGNVKMIGRDTTYNGYVSLMNFNVGQIMKMDSTLGVVSFEGRINGRGTNPKKLMANFEGKLLRMDAMGYQYHDISLNLNADRGNINALINSPDPNIRLQLEANADMHAKYPKVNFDLNIDSINLKNLKLSKEEFKYHGKISGNFETADVNYLNGQIDVTNSSIVHSGQYFQLDSVSLIAKADTASNLIMLKSQFLNAHLVGKYRLMELPNAMKDILQVYYQPGKPVKIESYAAQQFEFSAQLTRSRFIRDFFPDLTEMDDITLDGMFNSKEKLILAKLNAPKIVYAGTEVNNITVDINTADSTLYYSTLINKIKVKSIELTNTILSGKVIQNNADFSLWIKDNKDKERYHIGAAMRVENNNFAFRLLQDGLMLNYEKWQVDTTNKILFGSEGILAKNFRMQNKGQELQINSKDSTLNAPVDILFKNFRIETLTKMLESESLNIGGGIDGSATISRLESKPVFVSDVTINKFFIGKDTVGNIAVKVNNEKENTYNANITISENGNNVVLAGDFIAPPEGEPQLDFTLDIKPLTMRTIQAFSLGYLKESSGDVNGQLKITGSPSRPLINGDLNFSQAKFNVAMLNAAFTVENEKVTFDEEGINLNNFSIKDKKGNIAQVSGRVNTKTYTDFAFNLNINTTNFEVVNATKEDNDLFYGKLYLTSNLRIRGDLDRPIVDGTIKAQDNTDFVFVVPNSEPGVVERQGVVEFVDKSDTTHANIFAKLDSSMTVSKLAGIDVDVNLQTDKDAKFKIILDEGTQDALNIQGTAEINAGIDASNKISMTGTFTVEDGDYSFNFGPASRKFNFQKGSTITWNGDPLDARLNITAYYEVKAPTLELVQSQIGSDNANLYKQRIPFQVLLKLSEKIFQPKLDFDIDLNENNAIVSQDVISKVNNSLASLRENPSELNKQVFSLIVLGRFMAANPFESLSGGGGAEAIARNNISSFLSGQLNRLASSLIKGVELDFNLNSEQDYSTGVGETRTDLNIGISKMLFNDRLKITVGSNFEVEGNTRPGEQATNIAGDIQLDYQLSQDGRYFVRVYRKNQYQVTLQGQYIETGIGFIINVDYNRFKEIWMNSKKLQEMYNTDSRSFRKRFDVDRMQKDSVYRDSVRTVIRDSIQKNDPEFFKKLQQNNNKKDSTKVDTNKTGKNNPTSAKKDTTKITAIKNEEEERDNHEK